MTIHLTLPESLSAFVNEQAKAAGADSLDEYIVSVLRLLQQEKAEEDLEKLLLEATEALDRGESEEVTPEYWEECHQRLRDRAKLKSEQ